MKYTAFFVFIALAAGSSAQVADSTVTSSCPAQEVAEAGTEFFQVFGGFCYQFVTDDKEAYDAAQQTCESQNGTLAMPKTEDENVFLTEELTSTYNVQSAVWIGMHDKDIEGDFEWEDGSEVDWSNFEPFTHGLFGWWEDCIALNPSDGTWHDYRCSGAGIFGNIPLAFVCQYEITSTDSGNAATTATDAATTAINSTTTATDAATTATISTTTATDAATTTTDAATTAINSTTTTTGSE